MDNENRENWLCIYIYVEPPFENLLTDCVLSMSNELKNKKLIRKFFFIRYGEGGPHIRWRVYVSNKKNIQIIKESLIQKIRTYINLNNLKCSASNNKYIVLRKYKPELQRYGGELGVDIAENIFESSSSVIMKIIEKTSLWNYNYALYIALIINYIMCFCIIKNDLLVSEIMQFNYHRWLNTRYRFKKNNLSFKEFDIETRKIYIEKYLAIREEVLKPLIYYRNCLELNFECDPIIATWVKDINREKKRLNKLVLENLSDNNLNNSGHNSFLYSLMDSYIHMNNNRLGIKNQDESLVSFILYSSCKELYSNDKK